MTITVHDGVWADFPLVDISTAVEIDSVGAKKVGDVNFSPRAFRARIVRYWHSLGC